MALAPSLAVPFKLTVIDRFPGFRSVLSFSHIRRHGRIVRQRPGRVAGGGRLLSLPVNTCISPPLPCLLTQLPSSSRMLHHPTDEASITMRAASDQSESRLRCVQCSVVFKEVKRLNRHRREVCSVGERLHCDYAGCSITFKASRHKAAHIKKQHREGIARSLSPAEQSEPGFQEEDVPDFTMTTPPQPGQNTIFPC